jgi:ABC-type sugar transport system ATPase subunit
VTVAGATATASGFSIDLPRPPGVERAVLGIRPEDLTERAEPGRVVVEMKVDVVEVLGSDQYLYGMVGADELIARVDPHFNVAVGDRVRLGVSVRGIRLFDAQTDQALL